MQCRGPHAPHTRAKAHAPILFCNTDTETAVVAALSIQRVKLALLASSFSDYQSLFTVPPRMTLPATLQITTKSRNILAAIPPKTITARAPKAFALRLLQPLLDRIFVLVDGRPSV